MYPEGKVQVGMANRGRPRPDHRGASPLALMPTPPTYHVAWGAEAETCLAVTRPPMKAQTRIPAADPVRAMGTGLIAV